MLTHRVGPISLTILILVASYTKVITPQHNSSPAKTVLAVDFHGILAHLSLYDLVKNMPKGIVSSIQNVFLLIQTKGLGNIQGIHLKEAFHDLNTQRLQQDVFSLLKVAQKEGYKIVLFSNITPAEYEQYEKKAPDLFEDAFDLQIRTGPAITDKQGNWLTKSDQEFYRYADREIRKTFPEVKRIILLDDGKDNLTRAQKHVGWEGIYSGTHETTIKALTQLIAQ